MELRRPKKRIVAKAIGAMGLMEQDTITDAA